MGQYTKRAIGSLCAVLIGSAALFVLRSDQYRENVDWSRAISIGSAEGYREFLSEWRNGAHASEAVSCWKQASEREYAQLEWTSPTAVFRFIDEHPEYNAKNIRDTLFDAVIADGSYATLTRYLNSISRNDSRYDRVVKQIEGIVMAEVDPAVKSGDYQTLQRLARKYSDWIGCKKVIEGNALKIIEKSAKEEWTKLSSSKSEKDLRRFIEKYYGTKYADLACKRVDQLRDDLDVISDSGSLKGFLAYIGRHIGTDEAEQAWKRVEPELEACVFKRKTPDVSNSEIETMLEHFKQPRPTSRGLYGTCGDIFESSPLRIQAPTYGGDDYFVKLVNRKGGQNVGIFVRAGTTVEVDIPDGTYSVRYATGKQWYGTRLLFGINASYSRASQDFTFKNGSGYTITLQKVANGNLHTTAMSARDF